MPFNCLISDCNKECESKKHLIQHLKKHSESRLAINIFNLDGLIEELKDQGLNDEAKAFTYHRNLMKKALRMKENEE